MNDIINNHKAFVANQIEKSFDSGISVSKELDIEKAKWKVGDEKQYQGVTWVVGGFNAKGTPLWRKKKDGGSSAGGNATPAASTQTQAPAAQSSGRVRSYPTKKSQAQANQSTSQQTTAPATSQTSKTSVPKKDIPFEGLKTHREVFDYAKTLTSRGVKFKEVESDFGDKNSKAFVLSYPSGLDLKIDFLNNGEYVYNFSKNGDTLLGTNSTRDNEETDWSVMLDPNRFASQLISNISSSIGKWKSIATRYKRIYDRSNKSSDYYKYSDAASRANSLERRRAAAQKILQL